MQPRTKNPCGLLCGFIESGGLSIMDFLETARRYHGDFIKCCPGWNPVPWKSKQKGHIYICIYIYVIQNPVLDRGTYDLTWICAASASFVVAGPLFYPDSWYIAATTRISPSTKNGIPLISQKFWNIWVIMDKLWITSQISKTIFQFSPISVREIPHLGCANPAFFDKPTVVDLGKS